MVGSAQSENGGGRGLLLLLLPLQTQRKEFGRSCVCKSALPAVLGWVRWHVAWDTVSKAGFCLGAWVLPQLLR